jgi:NitT/TauT family transport system substrate-binding protein
MIRSSAPRSGATDTLIRCLLFCALLAGLAGACRPIEQAVGETTEIRLAVLPIIDALPFYVASQQDYFAAQNVRVTYIPTGSAAERDQLIAAGQADGMINDLVSVALYNKDTVQVQTVRLAATAAEGAPMFRVLAARDSGLTIPADLAGVPVGMSQGTVIDYVTARLLEKEGLDPGQIQSIAVPRLPDRLALLGSGELQAATLPEPFGTIALQDGAVSIVDDSKYPEYGSSVISFRKAFIDANPQAVAGFLRAVEQAVTDLNSDPDQWRGLLREYKLVPEALQESYPIPAFPPASVPGPPQWQDVTAWAVERALIPQDLPYGESVTDAYLPD